MQLIYLTKMKNKFMDINMNYYFTGLLIIAFILLALFVQPGYVPR